MRRFIVSDIHGLGNFYYSVMSYLDNISKSEEIELYINGDLFDRGLESAEILLDIKNRIQNGNFKIIYLGGNHELLMYEEYEKRKKGISNYFNDWYDNGGYMTDDLLNELLDYDKDKILEVVDFVSSLKIYHKFDEKINGKNILLVHAACPIDINDECKLKVSNGDSIYYYVWAREYDPFMPFRCKIGNDKYFVVVGHTPINTPFGYEYHKNQNYLSIDGGCSIYACGEFDFEHFPLVEVCDGYLRILTFNNNNEIIYGNYFDGYISRPFNKDELEKERLYLNSKLKVKKLKKNEDGVVLYK